MIRGFKDMQKKIDINDMKRFLVNLLMFPDFNDEKTKNTRKKMSIFRKSQ